MTFSFSRRPAPERRPPHVALFNVRSAAPAHCPGSPEAGLDAADRRSARVALRLEHPEPDAPGAGLGTRPLPCRLPPRFALHQCRGGAATGGGPDELKAP